MKELKIKKGRPLLNYVILTADRYTAEELAAKNGGIINPTELGQLKPYQTIKAISPHVERMGILEVGQLVVINIKRYGKAIQKQNSLSVSTDENYDSHVVYKVPVIELDGVEHLKLGDNDIEFIIEEYEMVEFETPTIFEPTEPEIIKPSGLIL